MKQLTVIENGSRYAQIDPNHGANCMKLRNKRYDAKLLREPPADGKLDNPYLYGMPILFPVNRIEHGEFEFEGRKYVFPVNEPATGCHLHGELHRMRFECLEKSDRAAAFRYRAGEGEYLGFPHAFEIKMEYALEEEQFCHTVTVSNLSEENMPLFLGFHTTFNTLLTPKSLPDDVRVFADITEEYERNMSVNYLPTGVKPPFDAVSTALSRGAYNPFDGSISRHYRGSGKMALTDIGNGLCMVYENGAEYGFRLIFGNGAGYICLEPQTCLANCQNSPFPRSENGFDFISPHSLKIYHSKIYPEEIEA